MPSHIKLIARFGNGLAALLFGLLALALVGRQPFAALLMIALCALALFNIYVIETCNHFFSEEAWLEAEIRKAELRHKLADLGGDPEATPPGSSGKTSGTAAP